MSLLLRLCSASNEYAANLLRTCKLTSRKLLPLIFYECYKSNDAFTPVHMSPDTCIPDEQLLSGYNISFDIYVYPDIHMSKDTCRRIQVARPGYNVM